ncbi:probable G-protein coupled receptor 160 [Anabas testudineus]|uniref:probable G-protein coupled receptor 160 n=1 Tax=Anabas testudineus TaxID=64144 RepID=UPI000E454C6A|nr:probable G-protein coupled receptor 160 [Anabas testudineus]XP_026229702.1 probable G-protein coupled receptor 160 [Anabas testudineus]XP_026229703.1 probable G-protein coupled receptor 160 [Anabas testudineus]
MHSTRIHSMNTSIPSILFSLGGKCLLDWVLVFLQKNHICSSFIGVFSVSLGVVDTTLTLIVSTIHLHSNGQFFLFGLQLTRYHICLLVQIVGQVYSALQFPLVVMTGLDHFCTISQRLQPVSSRPKQTVRLFVTILLWFLTALYIFLLSDFIPVLEDVSHYQIHQCWIFHTFQILQVAVLLFLTLGYATLYTGFSARLIKKSSLDDQITDQSRTGSRRTVISQTLSIFLNTWAIFLFSLAILLLLPVGIPSYLGLNVVWLCFLNSFLIGVVLCVVHPTLHLAQGLAAVPPDSFCDWRFKFSLAAEDRA